ncbi:MAG: hypothetical protein KME49_27025 [Brasilonema octagenarum HA4186-MV1]|jgi:hypothetical protein|nr:hypothetical protein [Brasilonema octagenarum HA4186-MV1]
MARIEISHSTTIRLLENSLLTTYCFADSVGIIIPITPEEKLEIQLTPKQIPILKRLLNELCRLAEEQEHPKNDVLQEELEEHCD